MRCRAEFELVGSTNNRWVLLGATKQSVRAWDAGRATKTPGIRTRPFDSASVLIPPEMGRPNRGSDLICMSEGAMPRRRLVNTVENRYCRGVREVNVSERRMLGLMLRLAKGKQTAACNKFQVLSVFGYWIHITISKILIDASLSRTTRTDFSWNIFKWNVKCRIESFSYTSRKHVRVSRYVGSTSNRHHRAPIPRLVDSAGCRPFCVRHFLWAGVAAACIPATGGRGRDRVPTGRTRSAADRHPAGPHRLIIWPVWFVFVWSVRHRVSLVTDGPPRPVTARHCPPRRPNDTGNFGSAAGKGR